MSSFTVDVVRDGETYIDWQYRVVVFRKPRVLTLDKPQSFRYVQAKCDGFRVVVARNYDVGLHVITTQGTDIADKCRECEWFSQLGKKLTDKAWIDGEIYLPGQGRESVSTALAERSEALKLAAFGVSHAPKTMSLEGVDAVLKKLNACVEQPIWSPTVDSTDLMLSRRYEPATNALSNVAGRGDHYDGVVFKDGMYDRWAKQKHELTIDLVVTGIKPGKGKYTGQCGALICSLAEPTIEVANVSSGLEDDLRAAITAQDIGRVCEVKYERVGARGRLQHPRFIAWRDDKQAKHCTADQDPRLSCLT